MKPAAPIGLAFAGFTVYVLLVLVCKPGDGGAPLQIPGKVPPPGLKVKRAFVLAEYRPDAEGRLRPRMPIRCPFAEDHEPCRLRVNHYRVRKTGPRCAVAVVGCAVHRRGCFTLYPPGHVPYGRKPVAPQGPSGTLYVREGTQATGTRLQPWWGASLFSASIDAAAGSRWPEESLVEDARRRRTQGRRLAAAGRLTGVHPALEQRTREQIAVRLSVPFLTLHEASKLWRTPWPSRGQAVVAVLEAMPLTGALPDGMLTAGAAAGLWPEPVRWHGQRRLTACSHVPEHVAIADSGSRSPPPTTSPVPPQEEGL